MKAIRGTSKPFVSVAGVPILGLGMLLLSLWHPPAHSLSDTNMGSIIMLQSPDPRLDRGLTICLRQQAKEVARCRRRTPADLAEAIAGYNIVARECTPAVFQNTGMPSSLEP